ncbi:MAG: hypothetical protein V3G42_07245 [Oscillospiraceae bacterium]
MAEKKKKKKSYRVRYDRVVFTALILAVLILMLTSCMSSCMKGEPEEETTPTYQFEDGREEESSPDNANATPQMNYATVSKNSEDIHKGDLILVNAQYPCEFDAEAVMNGTSPDMNFVTIKSILDTKDETHYTASDYEVGLDRTTAYSMDAWFEGFYHATGNSDLRIISGYEAGAGDLDFRTGRTLSIGTYPETGSSNFYMPEGIYSWIDQHSAEYGFILRYPEGKDENFDSTITSHRSATYRYVGIAPAIYMKEHNMCLEEFLETIRNYSVDNMITLQNGDAEYGLYFVPVNNSSPQTSFSVPAGDLGYEVSGNNMDGFVVTVALNESASNHFRPVTASD